MPEIAPFIGTHYDPRAVGDLGLVVCPPYDVITPETQEELYRRHKYNFVRLDMGKELPTDEEYSNRYERAARYFREWKHEGLLIEEEELSFYLCEQEFHLPSGEKRKRRGFFAAAKLDEDVQKRIRPHEQTFPGPKADRLRLLRATQCNLSPIVVLCPDPRKRMSSFLAEKMSARPAVQFADTDGVLTRAWICQDPADVQRLQELARDQDLVIADGHHRCETALAYRDEMRRAVGKRHRNMPFDYAMMFVISMEDSGLVVLPTHRALSPELGAGVDIGEVLGDLENYFSIEHVEINLDQPDKSAKLLLDLIQPNRTKQVRMAMILPTRTAHVLTLKANLKLDGVIGLEDLPPVVRGLDVSILHQFIIKQIWVGNPEIELDESDIIYARDASLILEKVRRRHACAGFLLNPTRMEQVREVADQGLLMPHKSTFFYPKVPSGIVARDISRHQ
ncbi:DUF1015 domain-containing protein [Candidatus Sumerlaeota bacterium]|nr:DUF1015 domain-containing protein [Candidatus Sumerlaeota bacterium]